MCPYRRSLWLDEVRQTTVSIQDYRTLLTWREGPRGLLASILTRSKNLCLDAPLVALVWQDFLARIWEAPIQPIHRVVLALITWLAYMGDRILDGPRQGSTRSGSDRHCFVWRHRQALTITWTLVALLGMGLALWGLPRGDLWPGLLFLASLVLYFLLARQWPRQFRGILPREILVGFFFSIACSLFIFSNLTELPPKAILGSLAFALLCSLDCWAISCADRERDLQQGEWNLVTTYRWARMAFGPATLLLSSAILAASFLLGDPTSTLFRALAFSGLLLYLLNRSLPEKLALYADLTLLAPLVFLLLT